ncbi:TauD/TfdA family dioxygenase [Novosphingobium sp. G106]|uniref:TauD/TfdA dioxygenase family protein n=1 Tax=Novosphingobium sp. G106 TaxID=2849500 RepID=UPI001C2D4203|nr:TauD/TfdA family dioxygenase [Novosphingobium sp. G106]MBV1688235.1 TauD/TfdA family dioxygenase [Novosphingobium sp. G106]
MTFSTVDLTPAIGTQVRTDRETLLDGSIAGDIRALLEQRGVLLFRGYDLSDEEQLQFAKTLGTPRNEHGTDITKVSSDKTKSPIFAEYTEGTYFFHFDDTYMEYPALASVLRARTVAPEGGQTEFANTYAIYDDLPEDERDFLDTLQGVHSQETIQRKAFPNPTDWQLSLWGEGAIPATTHPLVWHHRTGRKSLLLGETIRTIPGLPKDESDALIRKLLNLAERPEYVYRHEWQVGDVLIWDNTGTMHRVVPFDLTCGRELHRVKLAGEEPIRAPSKVPA